jgi:hypothetical protein
VALPDWNIGLLLNPVHHSKRRANTAEAEGERRLYIEEALVLFANICSFKLYLRNGGNSPMSLQSRRSNTTERG